jgi:hypothetical protein
MVIILGQGVFTIERRYGVAYNAQIWANMDTNIMPNIWHDVVIKLKASSLVNGAIAGNGSLLVILDKEVVVDYTGQVGYGTPLTLKSGLYQWNAPTNWDSNFLTKTMYSKGPYLMLSKDIHHLEMQQFLETL